jgi:hypothetical protein
MKEHKQRLGILLLALVLALGGLGVGYAHWTDSLYIAGTATTGEYAVAFVDDSCQFFPDEQDENVTCECTFSDKDGDTYPEIMEVDITNGSVYSEYMLHSDIQNYGDIPANIDGVEITFTSPVVIIEDPLEPTIVGTQVDPGDSVTLKLLITIHPTGAGTYNFTVEIKTIPWNQ